MAHDARLIANEVLRRAWALGHEPTQIDVQKIVYFLHGHHLRDHDRPLVAEPFQALHYGPVQQVLLDAFCKYGDEPIRDLAVRFDPVRRTEHAFAPLSDNASVETIERYLDRYLALGSFDMVEMTHADGTPWSLTVQAARNVVNVGMRITDRLIRERFEGIEGEGWNWQRGARSLQAS
jgi:uncharacterized phage-associated protein